MLNRSPNVKWADIAGLDFAKQSVQEIVVWPMLRPDIFTGLRGPPKGLLLFGPPGATAFSLFHLIALPQRLFPQHLLTLHNYGAGTGKTMIGKAIASESNSSFFSISASSLMSKWVGEGEKMVRALFAVAAVHQPSVVFIDEIDSLLSQRQDGDFESSRRVKTEFLVQLDGCATCKDDRILLIGATNRPQELDEAARRRMVKRLYIPLPDDKGRRALIVHLLQQQQHSVADADVEDIVAATKGYSGSDLTALCMESKHLPLSSTPAPSPFTLHPPPGALGPLRCVQDIRTISADAVRPVIAQDFHDALNQVRARYVPVQSRTRHPHTRARVTHGVCHRCPILHALNSWARCSVSDKDIAQYIAWNKQFGSFKVRATS